MAYKLRARNGKIALSNKETADIVSVPIARIQAKEFLSVSDAAKLLGVSRWTVGRAIKQSRLKVVKLGKRVVIKRSEIERMFA